eukprot:9021620-Heterocapsa_arctica.AAC.1
MNERTYLKLFRSRSWSWSSSFSQCLRPARAYPNTRPGELQREGGEHLGGAGRRKFRPNP